jgi:hypothetical protein
MMRFFKKAHKWVGLVLALLIVLFSLSGIVLNHRALFSKVDVNRTWLPKVYRYTNWNNAAVRSVEKIGSNRLLVYGNIGVWETDTTFSHFKDFNQGFPSGIDNRKIFKVLAMPKGVLAGTLFGLYRLDPVKQRWSLLPLPVKEENVVDLLARGDTVLVLTRSNLLQTTDLRSFDVIALPAPEHYDHKIGLFKTFWVIHSGEIWGTAGKLVVDAVALIFIALCIGGIVLFFSKRQLKAGTSNRIKVRKRFQWHLKWHNKIGWITAVVLLVTTLTGMFLRPPFLIAIAETRVGKIPLTELSTPNPWFDILRRIIYLPVENKYLVSTSEGFYTFDHAFSREATKFELQPPASVMGVTVLEDLGSPNLLLGSFEGLFVWNTTNGEVFDLIKQEPYVRPLRKGPPVGDHKISGYTTYFRNAPIVFDYALGAQDLNGSEMFPAMPSAVLEASPMSLWNLALEVHTGRIYQSLLGPAYILVVPLGGLLILLLLVSGVVVWFRHHRRS